MTNRPWWPSGLTYSMLSTAIKYVLNPRFESHLRRVYLYCTVMDPLYTLPTEYCYMWKPILRYLSKIQVFNSTLSRISAHYLTPNIGRIPVLLRMAKRGRVIRRAWCLLFFRYVCYWNPSQEMLITS